MKTEVQLYNNVFEPYISAEKIDTEIAKVAGQINSDYAGESILFIGVLNGSFMFCADLLKKITLDCQISFVKLSSYEGVASTGVVNELVGLSEDVKGKHVILLEDIVDSGNTIEKLTEMFLEKECNSLKVATLLYKPLAYKKDIPIDYIGIEIPNDFVVGYGLDYDGLGRNLNGIYKLKED